MHVSCLVANHADEPGVSSRFVLSSERWQEWSRSTSPQALPLLLCHKAVSHYAKQVLWAHISSHFCWIYRSLFLSVTRSNLCILSITVSLCLCIWCTMVVLYFRVSILILSYRQLLCSMPGLIFQQSRDSGLDNERILFVFMFAFYLEIFFYPLIKCFNPWTSQILRSQQQVQRFLIIRSHCKPFLLFSW